MRILVLILLFASTANAGPWHYIKTHKELLLSDSILVVAWSADAASSVHCQNSSTNFVNQCDETNKILGKHPGVGLTWTYSMAVAGVFVTANHLWWHETQDSEIKHFVWLSPVAWGLFQTLNVKANVNTAESLRTARARLK
jgi:hypothetical protein